MLSLYCALDPYAINRGSSVFYYSVLTGMVLLSLLWLADSFRITSFKIFGSLVAKLPSTL